MIRKLVVIKVMKYPKVYEITKVLKNKKDYELSRNMS